MSERWKPEFGQHYWCVQYTGDAVCFQWMNTDFQLRQLEAGNVFPTCDEATQACDLFKAMLLDLKISNDSFKEAEQYSEHNKLPDWCKVDEWCYCLDDDGNPKYFKITSIKDNYIYDEDWDIDYHFIKQARLRPYNAKEVPKLPFEVSEINSDFRTIVVSCKGDKVWLGGASTAISTEELLREFTIDRHPAGVLEHLENGVWVK